MKRFFFSLLALSAAFVSCTQSAVLETPDLFGTEITFNPYTGRTPETKATQIADANALVSEGGFHVLGYITENNVVSDFMDEAVTGSTSSEGTITWSYDGAVYWPDVLSDATLSFVAYNTKASNHMTWSDKTFTFAVPPTVSEQVDLLATNYQKNLDLETNTAGVVNLVFKHLLSRVGFKLVASNDKANLNITISKLTLTGKFPTTGTLDITAAVKDVTSTSTEEVIPAISPVAASTETTYSLLTGTNTFVTASSTNAVQIHNGTAANCYMMLMPYTGDATINVDYQIGTSSKKTAQVPLSNFTFAAGTAYEFILEVSTSAIGFTVQETDWNEADSDDGLADNYPVNPEPVEDIDLGVDVTGTTTASVAMNVNVYDFKEIYLEYKAIEDGGEIDETWADITTTKFTDYTAYEAAGPYSITLSNLKPNTKYQYRVKSVYADNDVAYYGAGTFITYADLATNEASSLTSFGATLSATYVTTRNGNANLKEIGFLRSDSADKEPTTRQFAQKYRVTSANDFTYPADDMAPNTTYYYRAYVVNEDGLVSYGDVVSFTTTIALEVPENGGSAGDGGSTGDTSDDPIYPWEGEDDTDNEIEF